MKKQILLFCPLFLFLILPLRAQISEGGTPKSFSLLSKSQLVPVEKLETVNVAKLLQEDAKQDTKMKPYRFAKKIPVNYTTLSSGKWEILSDGGRIWRMGIESTGAYSLNLIFSKYKLPSGANLFLYNEDHNNVLGAFTASNNSEDEILATYPVYGDKIYVELFVPKGVAFEPELKIGQVGHDYTGAFAKDNFNKATCEINVNCPEGNDWQKEKRAVCKIIIDGGGLCSGTMVNNTKQDGKPYFLTARHCIESNLTPQIVYVFNYEQATCTGTGNPSQSQTVSGSTLKASIDKLDFALFEMSSKPPASYKPYYVGWDVRGINATKSAGIHHAGGSAKKISISNTGAASGGTFGSGYDPNTHWKVSWNAGVTLGGSSGSGLFNQDHRLIGDLTGGEATCANISAIELYQQISHSWKDYPANNQQLKYWLDPNNTGVTTLNGYDPATLDVASIDYSSHTKIFPIPASEVLKINFNTQLENETKLLVYNNTGALIETKLLNNNENILDIKNLSSGIYFIRITDGNSSFNSRFIKQ